MNVDCSFLGMDQLSPIWASLKGQKPVNGAVAELPGAAHLQSGIWPLTLHVSQASVLLGIYCKVSSCQNNACPPPKAREPKMCKLGCFQKWPEPGWGVLCKRKVGIFIMPLEPQKNVHAALPLVPISVKHPKVPAPFPFLSGFISLLRSGETPARG